MKKTISVLVLSIISTTFYGQTLSSGIASNNSQSISPVFLRHSELRSNPVVKPPGLKMRNTARVLTIVGCAFIVGGAILYGTADEKYYRSTYTSTTGTVSEGDPQAGIGTVMMATGVGMTVPGIIFWSKGSKRYNEHLRQGSQTTSLQFNGNSLSFNYRF